MPADGAVDAAPGAAPMERKGTQYERIRDHLAGKVLSGEWAVGHRIPTEEALVEQFGVSRMTVHRAVRELVAEGLVRRQPGAGTFVTNERPSLDLVELRNIADDVRLRGREHSSVVHLLRKELATPEVADALGLRPGARVFHSVMVHLESGVPIQLEDRFVNPKAAPVYLEQDFAAHTPNAYLMTVGPLERVEHTIEAVLPDAATCELLRIARSEPCLLLHRRTWSMGRVVSRAWLTHPGSRYRLGASFGRAVAGKV